MLRSLLEKNGYRLTESCHLGLDICSKSVNANELAHFLISASLNHDY